MSDMKLPQDGKEVLVKLANGSYAVAAWTDCGCYYDWLVGDGIRGDDLTLRGKVVSWSELPDAQ